jgi:hypothetical protein
MSKTDYPSDEEIETAARIINRLPRGYLPQPLFVAVASKIVTPTLELVILKKVNEQTQVLLTKRPDDDKFWPGEWHIPGTVIRSTDTESTYESCFTRILDDELEGLVTITKPSRVSIEFWEIERGRELDQLFVTNCVNAQEVSDSIRFFPVDALPKNLMSHHREVIEIILQH